MRKWIAIALFRIFIGHLVTAEPTTFFVGASGQTQKRLLDINAFMKGIAAIGDRKGVTVHGWYPW